MIAVADRHLFRQSPPHAWEAAFFIGIFNTQSPIRWCKVHVFSGGRAGRHCLSAVEALDGEPERCVLVATERDISVHKIEARRGAISFGADRWEIAAPGLTWTGDPRRETSLDVVEPLVEIRATATTPLWWVKIPRVLSYVGLFGTARVTTSRGECAGLGVVEHAYGADVPFDPTKRAPKTWHWDVLRTGDDAAMAGLAIGALGRYQGVRAGGRIPGDPFATSRKMRLRVASWKNEEGRRVPARWTGTITTSAGSLEYEARPSTPVAPMVPSGGSVGNDWEGEWTPKGGSPRSVSGSGFTEYRAGD